MVIDRTQENRGNHTLRVVGRLRRGVALEQARDEMRAVAAAMEQEFPATNTNWGVRIETLSDTMLEPQVRRSLLLVLGAVAMVFLIACCQCREPAAGARDAASRGARTCAPRSAPAARGWSVSCSPRAAASRSISGAAGVSWRRSHTRWCAPCFRPRLPRLDEMRVDVNVLAFGLLISIVSGLVFGVVPALRASRLDLSRSLMLVGRATADSSRVRLRQMLIVAQIALATMLLVGAALLLQGFVRLQRVPLGFEPDECVDRTRVAAWKPVSGCRAGGPVLRTAPHHARRHPGSCGPSPSATSAPFAPGVRASFRLRDPWRSAGSRH